VATFGSNKDRRIKMEEFRLAGVVFRSGSRRLSFFLGVSHSWNRTVMPGVVALPVEVRRRIVAGTLMEKNAMVAIIQARKIRTKPTSIMPLDCLTMTAP